MNTISLPNSNDIKDVIASIDTWFFNLGEILVIPSIFPVNTSPKHYPETITAFTILEISKVTPDQAQQIQQVLGSEAREAAWGGPTSYMWGRCNTATINLVYKESEKDYSAVFPLYYYESSDMELILSYARNLKHARIYEFLGLDETQMHIYSFIYSDQNVWQMKS
ncbi:MULTISPECIES: hypothetical protein [unclassified Microcoleus]|uniref:hypothetical protein n=1 Tax=unclassified Microcoleus TaxID=2642155 RepID=UPI002FD706C4